MKIIITNLRSWMETHYCHIRHFYTTSTVCSLSNYISQNVLLFYSLIFKTLCTY